MQFSVSLLDYFSICFRCVCCSLKHFIMVALNTLSDNSYISVILVFASINFLFFGIQLEIFLFLGMMNDLFLSGTFLYYVMSLWILFTPSASIGSFDTASLRERGEGTVLLQSC